MQSGIGWAALVLILLSSLALGGNRPITWVFVGFAVCGLFAFQLLRDVLVPTRVRNFPLAIAACLYVAMLAFGLAQTMSIVSAEWVHPVWQRVESETATISADPIQGRHALLRLFTYGMLFWIGYRSTQSRERAGHFLRAIALFSTLLAGYGLYVLFAGNNFFLGEEGRAPFVKASFVNRNAYATFVVFGFLANLACFLRRLDTEHDAASVRQKLRNALEMFFAGSWVYALGALVCLSALVLTLSRAGAAAGAVGLVVFLLSYRLRSMGNGVMLTAVLASIIGFVVLTSLSGLTERFLFTAEEGGRLAVYPQIVAAIAERPMLGHGLGAFHDTFRPHVPLEAAIGEWHLAHNSYLENFYELGVPAAGALYAAIALLGLRIWWGTQFRQRDRVFSCFALGAAMAAGFHALFDFSLQMPAVAGLFAIILGMGFAQSFSQKRKHRMPF